MSIIQNEVIKTILERQTIRIYKQNQISQDELETIMAAALRAPSGRNSQPCHVRFLRNEKMLEEMNTDFKELVGYDTPAYTMWDVHPFYHNAKTVAFIFSENGSGISAGLMAENIALAAHSLGIGTCIIASIGSLLKSEEGKKYYPPLNIPENYKFEIAISMGYINEQPPMKPRDKSRFEIIE